MTSLSRNVPYFEKSSEMDVEESDDVPNGSPIFATSENSRAALLRSMALECECPSCDDRKRACIIRNNGRHMESDCWSTPELASAREWPRKTYINVFLAKRVAQIFSNDKSVVEHIPARSTQVDANLNVVFVVRCELRRNRIGSESTCVRLFCRRKAPVFTDSAISKQKTDETSRTHRHDELRRDGFLVLGIRRYSS